MIRTDLAMERREMHPQEIPGVRSHEITVGDARIIRIEIETEEGAQALQKPAGQYITIELPALNELGAFSEDVLVSIKNEISRLLPREGLILTCGLGNTQITPDALGPKTASYILATRHIAGDFAQTLGLSSLRPAAVIAPGVLGQTGIETGEILAGIVQKVGPAAVIVVDALASRRIERLGKTVQISNTGIVPGAGVGNHRQEISEAVLGVPVISIGVRTVVDAATLASDLAGRDIVSQGEPMMVTPRDIDTLIEHAARLISHSINCALHPDMPPEDLLTLAG